MIVALDVPNIVQGLELASRLGDAVSFYKIGLGILTGGGLALANELKAEHGKRIFMDLKLFDIGVTIEAAVRLLERDEVDGDASMRAKYRDLIGGENQRMRRQVDRVMEIATLDGGGNSDLKLERLDLVDIVRDAVGATEIFARDAEGEIRFDCKVADAPVMADRVHLTNVLCNLLDNAVRYAEKSPRIAVELHSKNGPGERGVWSVVVRDNGIGIPTEHLGRIFDRFFRVPTGDRHDVKGFGLGLHYVKSMVEAHGGTIRCESKPGFGSTFTVKLQKATDA